MKNGVPFDVAMDLGEVERFSWGIIFSEMDGAEFDTDSMRFIEHKPK